MLRKQVYRWADLARYNSEKARGIVHTPEWEALMAQEQARFDREQHWGDLWNSPTANFSS